LHRHEEFLEHVLHHFDALFFREEEENSYLQANLTDEMLVVTRLSTCCRDVMPSRYMFTFSPNQNDFYESDSSQ
jgi:hypothetical protein